MRKWELLNETAEEPQSMEEQAIDLLVSKIITAVENLPPMTMVATVENTRNWYETFIEIKKYLNEKVEED